MNHNGRTSTTRVFQQPWQFSLRWLLVMISIVAVGLALGVGVLLLGAILYCLFQRRFHAALGIFVVAAILFLGGVGQSTQVRLDTGDQRLCFLGTPFLFQNMASGPRAAILSLEDLQVPRRWVSCARQTGSNCPEAMIYGFYYKATTWVEADREVATLVIRDIADYVNSTKGATGLPNCFAMLWPDVIGYESDNLRVVDGWQKNPEVQAYLAAKGYSPLKYTEESRRKQPIPLL